MTDIGFYHLTKTPLERALPKLLEKILSAKKRAVVKVGSQARVESLNSLLWNTGRGSFIPHGSQQDGRASEQPIWLSVEDENPNGAQFLLLADNVESSQIESYERCLDIFNGNDADSVEAARKRWKLYTAHGYEVTYWKQSPEGKWTKG